MRTVALAACAALLLGAWPSAALTLCPGNFEIVTGEKPCAVVRFAAQELRDFCAGTLGAEVPVVARATPGRSGIHLGLAEWQAAGLATNRFTRDACAIRVHGGAVYVAGRDDPAADTFKAIRAGGVWSQHYERATIFGLYEFAERFLGVRLYFPGELGTVMPKKTHIAVPDDTDIFLAPVFLDRNVSVHSSGAWFEPVSAPPHPHNYSHREWPGKNLQSYRLRQETFNRPCCHGSNGFR